MMKMSKAMIVLLYVCMAIAMQAAATLGCGECEGGGSSSGSSGSHHKKKKPSPSPSPPSSSTPPSSTTTCSIDYKKLSSCSPLLGGILGLGTQCCGLLGLLNLDAVVCLCLALDANILGIIDIKVSKLDAIVSILTSCNKTVPKNLSCPS